MPLFECEQCHVVEQKTAFSNFWDRFPEHKPQLCSLCDPDIRHWHGHFRPPERGRIRARSRQGRDILARPAGPKEGRK
jgi:hypothetical protein